jgi:hypothetical protein
VAVSDVFDDARGIGGGRVTRRYLSCGADDYPCSGGLEQSSSTETRFH